MNSDPINPKHYKHLPVEAIEIIEAAIERAPTNAAAYHQGQVLKYLLRCWEKKGIEDLRKAKWYLDRMVDSFDDLLAESSGASETPIDDTEIPQGWRELNPDEAPSVGDKFLVDDAWVILLSNWTVAYGAASSSQVYIRKIEQPTKRYRDPTQADLRDGPMKCEYRDNDYEQWRSGFLVYILNGSIPFLCTDKEEQLSGQWNQCRIEEGE